MLSRLTAWAEWCRKTTIIQIFTGLFPPSSGGKLPKAQGLIGIVPQEIAFLKI